MEVINAMFVSAMVGIVIALPAMFSELTRRGKNLPILVDVKACWGRVCTPEETFILSLFMHLLLAVTFGGLYMLLALLGWRFHDFRLLSILEYGLYFWVFVGVMILPLVKLGIFGRREGRFVWLELLSTYVLQSLGLWAAWRLFPVFLP